MSSYQDKNSHYIDKMTSRTSWFFIPGVPTLVRWSPYIELVPKWFIKQMNMTLWNLRLRWVFVMMSSNANVFRVTGHLCGEFTGHQWIPHTKASDVELWCFLVCAWIIGWLNNGEAGDLRCHHTHYDITIMCEMKHEWYWSMCMTTLQVHMAWCLNSINFVLIFPYSKVHGANMGPIWVLSAPDGPCVGPMNLAIRCGAKVPGSFATKRTYNAQQ